MYTLFVLTGTHYNNYSVSYVCREFFRECIKGIGGKQMMPKFFNRAVSAVTDKICRQTN